MWIILVQKIEKEAYEKANSAEAGEGLFAFVRINDWFSRTTELGKTNRVIALMKPAQCKQEWEVATAVERWEESY